LEKLEFNKEELDLLFEERRKNFSPILRQYVERKKSSFEKLANDASFVYLVDESDEHNEKIPSWNSLKSYYYGKRIPKEKTIRKIGKFLKIPPLEKNLGFMSYGLDFTFGYLYSIYSDDVESGYININHKMEVENFLLKLFHMNIENRIFFAENINLFNTFFSNLSKSEWEFLLTLSELDSLQLDTLNNALASLRLKPDKKHSQNQRLEKIYQKFSSDKQEKKDMRILDSIEPLRNYFKREPLSIKNFLPLEVDILTMDKIDKNLFSVFLSFPDGSKEKTIILSLKDYIEVSIGKGKQKTSL
jgi:hypothetical protein